MKKLVMLSLIVCLLCVGCSTNKKATDENMKRVGVIQIVSHGSLDESYQGFIDGMANEGFIEGENVTYDFQNAHGDTSTMTSISQKLVSDDVDLILTIGTNAALSAQSETTSIPIVGTAITDYEGSKLVASNENPGGNITGLSDNVSIEQQMDLLYSIAPEAKTIGIIYSSSELNSQIQAEEAAKEIEKRGGKPLIKTVADQTMITDTLQSMVGKVDAIYIPTDNGIASSMGAVETITSENKIPTIVGAENMCVDGGLAGIGINYYNLGVQTGEMAARILKGEADPATTPVEYLKEISIYYNSDTAEKLGIVLPEEIISKGKDVKK